jgi:hypothetical protein
VDGDGQWWAVFIRARVVVTGTLAWAPQGGVPSLIEPSGDFVQGWLCLSFVLASVATTVL